jgi:hypothetical protein
MPTIFQKKKKTQDWAFGTGLELIWLFQIGSSYMEPQDFVRWNTFVSDFVWRSRKYSYMNTSSVEFKGILFLIPTQTGILFWDKQSYLNIYNFKKSVLFCSW